MVSRRAPRRVVVDPSLTVAWVLAEAQSARAIARLEQWERSSVRRIAPALYASEVGTALLRAVRRGVLAPVDAEQSLTELLAAVTIRPHDARLARRAFEIARTVGAGKIYDAMYAALAERERIDLWTGDERFYRAASPIFPWIHWVGEED